MLPTVIEIWKDLPNRLGYQVSNYGRVISYWRRVGTRGAVFSTWKWELTDRPKLLTQSPNKKGYPMVRLQEGGKQKFRSVHLLVLEAFVGPRPSGMVGRHLNDEKVDTRLGNLAWGTPSRNMQERNINGKNPNCKITPADVLKIRQRLGAGETQKSVAKHFHVTPSAISQINRGRSWGYIE